MVRETCIDIWPYMLTKVATLPGDCVKVFTSVVLAVMVLIGVTGRVQKASLRVTSYQ